jgi:hypothetical protein
MLSNVLRGIVFQFFLTHWISGKPSIDKFSQVINCQSIEWVFSPEIPAMYKLFSIYKPLPSGLLAGNPAGNFVHVTKQCIHAAKPTEYAMKSPPGHPVKTVAFPMKNGYRMVRCEDIVRCEAAGNYTTVFLANGQDFSLCKRLKEVEGMLPGEVFCRVHQSHLVNLGWVEMWVREGLVLANGVRVAVAKGRREELKKNLQIKKSTIY